MTEPRRVAITGAAGFIGRHFCRRLLATSALASTLDIRPFPDRTGSPRHVIGDIRDDEALRRALSGTDAVLHLAAAHHDFGIDEATFYSVNEGGARAICRVMDELGIRRICFYSSVAVYGRHDSPPRETDDCRPESHYGRSKLAGERVFEEWAGKGGGRSVLVIRPSVTFGAGHFANMYTLIRQIASGLYVGVGEGSNRKSLVYVDNLVAATLLLWERDDLSPFEVFNVVDKPDLDSRSIAAAVCRGLGRRPPAIQIPLTLALLGAKPFDAAIALTGLNLPVSSARIRKFAEANTVFSADKLLATGFRAPVSLQDGIDRMVQWYLDEGRGLPIDRSLPPAHIVPLKS